MERDSRPFASIRGHSPEQLPKISLAGFAGVGALFELRTDPREPRKWMVVGLELGAKKPVGIRGRFRHADAAVCLRRVWPVRAHSLLDMALNNSLRQG